MKLITRDTDYAVRALCYIAGPGKEERIFSVTELVRELKMPRPFLRKILQALNKGRILISHKGKGGGFSLGKPASAIYLVDLMRIFQGALRINECIFKRRVCPNKNTCALRRKLGVIEEHVILGLKGITIKSLLNDRR